MANAYKSVKEKWILTFTFEALFVDPPDEVPALVAPGGRGQVNGLETMSPPRLLLPTHHEAVHVVELNALHKLVFLQVRRQAIHVASTTRAALGRGG